MRVFAREREREREKERERERERERKREREREREKVCVCVCNMLSTAYHYTAPAPANEWSLFDTWISGVTVADPSNTSKKENNSNTTSTARDNSGRAAGSAGSQEVGNHAGSEEVGNQASMVCGHVPGGQKEDGAAVAAHAAQQCEAEQGQVQVEETEVLTKARLPGSAPPSTQGVLV